MFEWKQEQLFQFTNLIIDIFKHNDIKIYWTNKSPQMR